MRMSELVVVFLVAPVALGTIILTDFRHTTWAQPGFFVSVAVFLGLFIHMLTAQAAASIGAHRERDRWRDAV